MFNSQIIDDLALESIPDALIFDLRNALHRAEFTSANLLKIFGKEVMRHINIGHREEDFLRRQVLHGKPILQVLVDFFLLHKVVAFDKVSLALGVELTNGLIRSGLMAREGEEVGFRGFLTPLANGYFLNDGDVYNENPGHVIQIVLEQPYLIKAIELANSSNRSTRGRILDLCSGSGIIGQAIQAKGWSVTGWDINPRALNYARFNARLNGLLHTSYLYSDVLAGIDTKESYDLIVANPPYNANVTTSQGKVLTDITLHSGVLGWDIPSAILDKVDSLLVPNGLFAMCGIHLMKNNRVAHPAIEKMSTNGSVLVLHKVISPARTWEGMRCQFNCTPRYSDLPDGRLLDVIESADFFDAVTWAITIWKKGGKPGYSNIYNLPTDGVLLSPQATQNIYDLLN